MILSFCKRTGRETFLIPELCRMTGLSKELLEDFKAMKDIKQVSHSDAPIKVKECLRLFSELMEN
jgi:hypothetical protein